MKISRNRRFYKHENHYIQIPLNIDDEYEITWLWKFKVNVKGKYGIKCILSYNVPVHTTIHVTVYQLWCKVRYTIDISNYRSWFRFWDNCFVWLEFLFFETFTQPFCKRHNPVIVIIKTRHALYTGTCTRLYIFIKKITIMCFMNTWTRVSPHSVIWN